MVRLSKNIMFLAALFGILIVNAFGQISFLNSNITSSPNNSLNVPYSISGSQGGQVILQIENTTALSNSGINVSLSDAMGAPPFSGTVFIGVSRATPPGKYSIILISSSGGAPATLTLNILPASAGIGPGDITLAQQTGPQNNVVYAAGGVALITAAVIVYYIYHKRKNNTPPGSVLSNIQS